MNEHEQIQQLISAYLDGEASQQEQQKMEAHLEECAECRKFYEDMKKLSSSLETWTDEALSPDAESQINRNIREGKTMKKKTLIPVSIGSTILVGLLAVVVAN